nr:helix-hairpin-helix domain-containing protein [Natranaeroarchaeum aerophilus]
MRYIGPATAETLRAESVAAADIRDKRVSYQLLVDAGINAGVATKIRRWHSLPWTFGGEGSQLDNRSKNVRGLRDGERKWVAASTGSDATTDGSATDGDWSPAGSADGRTENRSRIRDGDWTPSGDIDDTDDSFTEDDWTSERGTSDGETTAETDGGGTAVAAESAWRERSKPDPITAVAGVTEDDAELLAEAGITSVRRLATADPEQVADLLDIEHERVEDWHSAATSMTP